MEKKKRRKDLSGLLRLIQKIQKGDQDATRGPSQVEAIDQENRTFLIVGLGNPGREYAGNRHNIGFMLIDHLASHLGIHFSRTQNKALITDSRYEGEKLILAKPQTYMNLSGQAVAQLVNFYKIPLENLLVAYDEMDLPLGTLRIRPHGGSGGHKGMKSIIQHLGNQQHFPRLRLGLGRPPGRMDPTDYLLQDFSKKEIEIVDTVLKTGIEALLTFVTEGVENTMNQYNGSIISNE